MDTKKKKSLLELSKKTLKSYVKKADKSATKHSEKANKEEDKAMSTDGHKYPAKQERHNKAAGEHIRKLIKRSTGVNTAMAKLKNEEVDMELNETMTRKHFQQVADVIKAHPSAKKRTELAAHHAGIFAASNPRFDHDRFYKAANAQRDEVKKEDVGHEALFNAIIDGNREEANGIFDSVVSDRLDTIVANKKKEIASTLFNQPGEEGIEEELDLLGITEEFEPLELIAEEVHGQHHQIYSELTDRNKRLADAAANSYSRGDINKDHKREVMRHFNLADKRLDSAKTGLGSAESADHLNAAATHITDGGSHLDTVRAHTSLGYRSY